MYFLVVGLSIKNLLQVDGNHLVSNCILPDFGRYSDFRLVNYFRHKRKIEESKIHVGN
jgi:putative membrane protein